MSRVSWILATALLAGGLLSGSLLTGCGGKVCEDAYDKMQSCIEKLNCSTLGPLEYDSCQKTKSSWQKVSRSEFITACGLDSTEADKISGCTLDPRTCKCP